MRLFLLLIVTILSVHAEASVWDAQNQWNDDWETKYSTWIDQEFSPTYFLDGPYGQIVTDCADAVYAARAIFSYENSLPFVAHAADGQSFVTNKTTAFDDLPTTNAERLKAFLTYVFNSTDTSALTHDTYPIVIDRTHIRPGVVWLRPSRTADFSIGMLFGIGGNEVGHAEVVKDVSATGVVTLMSSTVPASARELKELTDFFILPQEKIGTGLRAWKWPEQENMNDEDIPGYSNDQYNLPHDNINVWTRAVQDRLALSPESRVDYLKRMASNFCVLAKERVAVVNDSEIVREQLAGACMDAGQYEDYSTPGRDKNLSRSLSKLIKESGPKFGEDHRVRIERLRPYLEQCGTIEFETGHVIDYTELAYRVYQGKLSSDPNVPIEARWGETSTKSSCEQY